MTKSMAAAVVILLLLFSGCAFFIVLLQRDELEKDVQYFLIKNKIRQNVEYGSVSVPLSDIVTLNDVEIRFSPYFSFPNKIRSFSVVSYRETKTIPSALSVSAKGIRFKISDALKSRKKAPETVIEDLAAFDPVSGIFTMSLETFLLSGCDSVNADADIRYAYLPDAKKMSLYFKIKDGCLGQWQFGVSLDNISNEQQGRLAAAAGHLLKKGDPVQDLRDFLKGATVTAMNFSYTESKLVTGYKKYVDSLYLRLPGQPSPAEIDSKGIQSIVSYMSFSSPHRLRNTEIARKIADFVKNPETISFQSKAGKKAALKALRGNAFRRLTELLLRLDISVQTESSVFGTL